MNANRYTPVQILLVEDNIGDIRLTYETFKDEKICNDLHTARDGVEALAFLRREGKHKHAPRPDIILLDLNMPGMDGKSFLEAISDSEFSDIPVVILTSSHLHDDVIISQRMHAKGFITKPIDLGQILQLIRNIGEFSLCLVKQESV